MILSEYSFQVSAKLKLSPDTNFADWESSQSAENEASYHCIAMSSSRSSPLHSISFQRVLLEMAAYS